MRIVTMYSWKGVASGSAGKILSARTNTEGAGTLLKIKFDYGETHEVPQVATISEVIFKKQNLTPKD